MSGMDGWIWAGLVSWVMVLLHLKSKCVKQPKLHPQRPLMIKVVSVQFYIFCPAFWNII
jgi:hypothetical protein